MTTIPSAVLIGVLIFAVVVSAATGAWVSSLYAAAQAKRWQTVRDDLREQRDKGRERLSESTKRLRECKAVLAKIRGLLPETSGTYTRP